MKVFPSVIAFVILVPLVAFSQGDKGKYITKSHLNKVPPEIANGDNDPGERQRGADA